MKLRYFAILLFLSGSLFIRCGGNPEADGDQAYAKGNYNQALTYYLEVKKSQPNNPKINEKIALTYMQRGLQFFKKQHNLVAFDGNFDKGEEFIPEETSENFNKEYSKMLYELGMAYHNSQPENQIQKEQYFTKMLDNLNDALLYDENNSAAKKALEDIKRENFQQTYDKGLRFFKQAKKEKNLDLYLTAERYLNRAASFNPDSKEAQKDLKLVRKKTLSIVDMDETFPVAVADYKYQGKFLLIAFTGINNSGANFEFDPAKVKLIDIEENVYTFDAKETAKYDDGLTQKVILAPRKQLDGTLAFAIRRGVKISHLAYELAEGKEVKKYFP